MRMAIIVNPSLIILSNNVNLSLCPINRALRHEDIWRSGGMTPSFLTSPLGGGEWSASCPCHLLARWFLAELIFSTLQMEATCSSETSVDTQWTALCYITDDGTFITFYVKNIGAF
jgi:hypothetical protein